MNYQTQEDVPPYAIPPYFIGEVVTIWMHPTDEEKALYDKLSWWQKLKVNWSGKYGRKMKLVEDFIFVDKYGVIWKAKKDTLIDGSSIPRLFWVLVGSPFVGLHRRASVLHDPACVEQERPHKQVHQMYEDACIADGVLKDKAERMHKFIKLGGPKWKTYPERRKGI